jgi:hypothetical protein
MTSIRSTAKVIAVASAVFAPGTGVAAAHPHQVSVAHGGAGQVIANGQNHGPFVSGVSCGGHPAAYGLETAHHGPDAGIAGAADGCYQTTGSVAPGLDVANPVTR